MTTQAGLEASYSRWGGQKVEGLWIPETLVGRGNPRELLPRNTHIGQCSKKKITFYNFKLISGGAEMKTKPHIPALNCTHYKVINMIWR